MSGSTNRLKSMQNC